MSLLSSFKVAFERGETRLPNVPMGWSVQPVGNEHDDVDDSAVAFNIAGVQYGLDYSAISGNIGIRPVTIRKFFYYAPRQVYYLGGHCHVRSAYRLFRVDEIRRLVDLSTGEIFPEPLTHLLAEFDVEHREQWFDQSKETLERRLYRVLTDYFQHELQLLAYLGWVDGKFCDQEKTTCLSFLQRAYAEAANTELKPRLRGLELPAYVPMSVEEKLAKFIDRIGPDCESFAVSCQHVLHVSEARRERFIKFAQRLVQSDSELSTQEMSSILELKAY